MIRLALKNICNSLKSHRKIYIILVVSQLLSILSIYFVYGIYFNYTEKLNDLDIDRKNIATRYENCDASLARTFLDEIFTELEANMDYVFIGLQSEGEMRAMSYVTYSNGLYGSWNSDEEIFHQGNDTGITDEDEQEGRKVVFSYRNGIDKIGGTIIYNGEEYEVVGLGIRESDDIVIPFSACPDDTGVWTMYFFFKDIPTTREYHSLAEILKKNLGDKLVYIDEFERIDNERTIAYRTIIAISGAIGIMSALNTCILFGYILSRRTKLMAVYGITGATDRKRIFINEIEILIVSAMSGTVGFLLFRYIFQGMMSGTYEYTEYIYSLKSYGIMTGIYEICILMFTSILLSLFNRGRLTDIVRRAEND